MAAVDEVELALRLIKPPLSLIQLPVRADRALGTLTIRFNNRWKELLRHLDGSETLAADRTTLLSPPCVLFFHRHTLESPPSLCKKYFLDALSAIDIDSETVNFLATEISRFAAYQARALGYAEFSIEANVEFVHVTIHDEAQLIPRFIRQFSELSRLLENSDSEDVRERVRRCFGRLIQRLRVVAGDDSADVRRLLRWLHLRFWELQLLRGGGIGAAALDKLKKEGRFEVKEDDDGELGICCVCLEDLCAAKELLRMPCSHAFHESCIFTWLEKKNSCPLCRSNI